MEALHKDTPLVSWAAEVCTESDRVGLHGEYQAKVLERKLQTSQELGICLWVQGSRKRIVTVPS